MTTRESADLLADHCAHCGAHPAQQDPHWRILDRNDDWRCPGVCPACGAPDPAPDLGDGREEFVATCIACSGTLPTYDGGGPFDCTICGAIDSAWEVDPPRRAVFPSEDEDLAW